MKKTHEVLDLHYTPDEGQACYDGTEKECNDFASRCTPSFMYKVVPMTKEEIETHPDNILKVSGVVCGFCNTNCEVSEVYFLSERQDGKTVICEKCESRNQIVFTPMINKNENQIQGYKIIQKKPTAT